MSHFCMGETREKVFIDESGVGRYNNAAFADSRFIARSECVAARRIVRAGGRKKSLRLRSPVAGLSVFRNRQEMSLLSEHSDAPALAGVGRISAILLLAALVGRLLGHVVARFALSICCLMRAFWTGTIGARPRGARRFEPSAPRTAGPETEPAAEILVCLPNA
jgi:hypothetical protein